MVLNRAQWIAIRVGVVWLAFAALFPPFTNPACGDKNTRLAETCLICIGPYDLCEVSRFCLHRPIGYSFDIGLSLAVAFFILFTVVVSLIGLRDNVWWVERFAFRSTMLAGLGFCLLEIFSPSVVDYIGTLFNEILFPFVRHRSSGLVEWAIGLLVFALALAVVLPRSRKLALKTIFICVMVLISAVLEGLSALAMPGVLPPNGFMGVHLYNFSVGLALQLAPIDVLSSVVMFAAVVIGALRKGNA
jgi:hypothetical protein